MARLKYMGTSHVRTFEKGETWNNRLDTPLAADIEFKLSEGHVIDTSAADIPESVVSLILEDPEFTDISDFEVAPTGYAEQLYLGRPVSQGIYKDGKAPEPTEDSEGQKSDKASDDAAIKPHNPIETNNVPPSDPNAVAVSEAKAKAAKEK